MILSSHHSFSPGIRARILVVIICLALAAQGAHFCPLPEPSGAGIQALITPDAPACSVCALAYSVLMTVLLIIFSLGATGSRTPLVSAQVRSFQYGLRLDMRAPPAL